MNGRSEVDETALLQRVAAQCGSVAIDSTQASTTTTNSATTTSSWSLPGFGAGARVATAFGNVPVELLCLRDPIKTRDGRFLSVQHLDKVRLDRRYLLTHPDAQPVEIRKDELAPGIPSQTILMSGFQEIAQVGRFDQVSADVAADYVELGRAERKLHGYFTYYVFHCGERCTANIDGIWVDLDPDSFETPED